MDSSFKVAFPNHKAKILLSQNDIQARIRALGKELEQFYGQDPVIVLTVLTGAFRFSADLMSNSELNSQFYFISAKSYLGTESMGSVKIKDLTQMNLKGKRVLVVEDIIDSGLTLVKLKAVLVKAGAAEIKVISLLNKQEGRKHNTKGDWVGFEIPLAFVVGYGLDLDDKGRQLNDIWGLES